MIESKLADLGVHEGAGDGGLLPGDELQQPLIRCNVVV